MQSPRVSFLRWATFVLVNGSLCLASLLALQHMVPVIRGEPASLLVVPMSVISAAAFATMYPLLLRWRLRLQRAALLYAFFLLGLLAYGAWLTAWLGGEPRGFYLAFYAGHWFGLPILAGLGIVNLVLSPLLCPAS